jgi:hypothetical protein
MLRVAGAAPADLQLGGEHAVGTDGVAAAASDGMRLYAAQFLALQVMQSCTTAPLGMHLARMPAGT